MRVEIRVLAVLLLTISCQCITYSMDIPTNERVCFYEVFGTYSLTQRPTRNTPLWSTAKTSSTTKSKWLILTAGNGRLYTLRTSMTDLELELIRLHLSPPPTLSVSRATNPPPVPTRSASTLVSK